MKNCISFLLMIISFSAFAQTGTVRGYLYDEGNGEPVLFGNVLVDDIGSGTTTDLDGAYVMELAPGTYSLTFSFIGYTPMTISDVVVTDGEVTTLDARIAEESQVIEEVVITAKQARNTEVALATIKRKSTNLLDGISSASFKKIGDSDAASAIKRVSGVSVEGGKYVYVRGLGDRYTKSILNGMDIPGLDPDRNTIQLDLFPTSIIDNIIVVKSFTADLPADFTGGIVDINTKDFPDERNASISVGIGYNPSMHFNNNNLTYAGGGTDFLGFDDGTRAIPTDRRTDIPTRVAVLSDPSNQTEYTSILNGFNPQLGALRSSSFMDYSAGFSLGDQINKNGGTLGYTFNVSYKNSTDFYEDAVFQRYGKGNTADILDLELRESQIGDYGTNNVLIAGMGGLSYKKNANRFSLNVLRLQNGESTAGLFDYIGADQGSNFTATQHNLEYSERSVTNALLSGSHSLNQGKYSIDWKVSPTVSSITDPDIRFTRVRTDGTNLSIGTESGVPQRIWRYLDETNISGKVDLTNNYTFADKKAKLKVGGGYTYKHRDYEIQNFAIFTGTTDVTEDVNTLFEEENFFDSENIGGLYYEPQFIPVNANSYEGRIESYNAYISNEFEPIEDVKFVVGLRLEDFSQFYTGINQARETFFNVPVLDDLDLFPTANIIYALNDNINIRSSFSKTIARPSFKEASFATIIDPLSGRTFIGGFFPDIDVATGTQIWDGNLRSTDIYNYDVRFELYKERGQNISISGFYKSFINPIEIVQYVQAANNFQPRNVGDGRVIGVEVEFLKYLGDFESRLGNLGINGNVTVASSKIEMNETEFTSRINNARVGEEVSNTREMAGQAPYVINAGISYKTRSNNFEIGTFYNVQGETLQYVGIADRPDVFSKPFHSLNISGSYTFGNDDRMKARFKLDNILSSDRESVFQSFNTDDQLFSSLSPNRSISLSLSYTLF
ncbi:TonB-dependent receptor [Saprospiraceae bacterium]|nr:TonB-dependent receptor [Saprospiraceae bacterium]